MSLRRFQREINPRAAQGRKGFSAYTKRGMRVEIGQFGRHIEIRTAPDGREYEFHPRKGFRRWTD
jgi:hypothetical protein